MRVAGNAARGGRHAIQEYKGAHIPCYDLQGDDLEEYKSAEGEYDARVLSVQRGGGGARHRTWKEVVEGVTETPFTDFAVEGPRTVRWCVAFIARRQGGPMDHHRWWTSSYGLSEDDALVKQHELTMKVLELFGSYDQLDLGNLAGLERLLREAPLTEWHFEEKRRASLGSRADSSAEPASACFALSAAGPRCYLLPPSLLVPESTKVAKAGCSTAYPRPTGTFHSRPSPTSSCDVYRQIGIQPRPGRQYLDSAPCGPCLRRTPCSAAASFLPVSISATPSVPPGAPAASATPPKPYPLCSPWLGGSACLLCPPGSV